jgi:hypothetical protein
MPRLSLIAAAMLSLAAPAWAQPDGDERGSAPDPAAAKVDAPSVEPLPAANELAFHRVRDVDDSSAERAATPSAPARSSRSRARRCRTRFPI